MTDIELPEPTIDDNVAEVHDTAVALIEKYRWTERRLRAAVRTATDGKRAIKVTENDGDGMRVATEDDLRETLQLAARETGNSRRCQGAVTRATRVVLAG